MDPESMTKPELIVELEKMKQRIASLEQRISEGRVQSEGIRPSGEQAEDELRESKALFEAVVENVPLMIFLKEAKDLRFVIFNRAGEELLGYDRKDLMGKNNLDLFPPEQAAHFMAKDREVLEGAGYLDIPVEPISTAKKGERLLHTQKVCIRGADGTTKFLLGISEDITERKRAEEELQLKDAAMAGSFTAIAIANLDRTVRYVNDAFLKLFNYSSLDEVIGRPVASLEMTQGTDEHEVLTAIQRDGVWVGERELRRGDGQKLWVQQSSSLIKDQNGRPMAMLTLFTDITERRRMETTLLASETKYRSIFTGAADGILMTDVKGAIKYANPGICRMLGYTEGELCTMSPMDIHPKDELPWILDKFEAMSAARETLAENLPCLRKDGAIIYVDINSDRIEMDGQVLVVGFFRDITTRKRMEDELKASEAKFRSIFNATTDGILAVDASTRTYKYVNPAACRMFGYTDEEFRRLGMADVHPQEDLPYITREFEAHARKEKKLAESIPCLRKDGTVFFAEINSENVVIDGTPLTVGFFRDITDRKRAEAELVQRTVELERSNRELEQFAYVASHDLQEPLRMVSSYTQLLANRYKDKLDEDANDFIDFAVSGASRMQRLINDLLEYSRVGTRGKELTRVDAHNALGQAVVMLGTSIEETQALVTNQELPTVFADQSQLTQVFLNLIGNAIKFRREGHSPRIHISARPEGTEWVFSVQDNAVGIEPQYYPRLFQIFQRLHGKEFPGTGIGLALCKRIIERHRGRIWVESAPGEGSTFYFTLPMKGEEANGPGKQDG